MKQILPRLPSTLEENCSLNEILPSALAEEETLVGLHLQNQYFTG